MIAFSVAAAGILSLPPLFWTIPTTLLRGVSAAAGIAAINSVGNLSGFVSPYMIGAITDATGEATIGLYVLAASLVASAGLSIAATATPARR
jgi:nitrate/nitrite transporter NarK